MSPREALRRLTSFTPSPADVSSLDVTAAKACHVRVSGIAAEIAAMPERVAALPLRRPADALRWFVATDVVALTVGFFVAWGLVAFFNPLVLGRVLETGSFSNVQTRFAHFGFVAAGVVLWFLHTGHYRMRMPFWLEIQKIVRALGFALMVDGFFQFAAKQDPSRLWLVSAWVFVAAFLLAGRTLTRSVLRRRGLWSLRTLLVGSGPMADAARAALRSEPNLGYEVVMQVENLPLLLGQTENSWEALCARFNAEYVVLAMDGPSLTEAGSAIARLGEEGIPFSVSPPLRHLPVLGMTPQYFFNHDVMLMAHDSHLDQPLPRLLKRTMDIAGALAGLIVLTPLFVPLVLLIRRDGGPAFYGDARVGLGGKAFSCLKFRSMVLECDAVLAKHLAENPEAAAEWKKYYKLRGKDPRVTAVGAFIRKWSLDELPQLLNVLRGDMSLVGPRPIRVVETADYCGLSAYARVRPGLTGLWQVSGRSNATFAQRAQMDKWYIRNWSLWQDIAILFKTLPVVFKRTGAC